MSKDRGADNSTRLYRFQRDMQMAGLRIRGHQLAPEEGEEMLRDLDRLRSIVTGCIGHRWAAIARQDAAPTPPIGGKE